MNDVERHSEWASIGHRGLPMRMNVDLEAKPDDPRPEVKVNGR